MGSQQVYVQLDQSVDMTKYLFFLTFLSIIGFSFALQCYECYLVERDGQTLDERNDTNCAVSKYMYSRCILKTSSKMYSKVKEICSFLFSKTDPASQNIVTCSEDMIYCYWGEATIERYGTKAIVWHIFIFIFIIFCIQQMWPSG